MRGITLTNGRQRKLVTRAFLLGLAAAITTPPESYFATSSSTGPQLHVESANRVNVYVYDDPVFDQTEVLKCYLKTHKGVAPWQDERTGGNVQEMGEIWLHQSLLSHPWRVSDPEEAEVFFVPLYPVLTEKLRKKRKQCGGLNSYQRTTRSIMHLVKNSPYFNRFGGADHVVVCTWWNCGRTAVLGPQQRMLLRRAVLGTIEKLDRWSMWGCRERMVTAPYTPNSALTTAGAIGGLGAEERTIPFFFVGTARARPERLNLQVVKQLSPDSIIDLGESEHHWAEDAGHYADHMFRSRFCFCPRGDTMTSRRFFDAISAGCIPIIASEEVEALPFMRTGLNYSEFVVEGGNGSLSTTEGVEAIVKDLSTRSDEDLIPFREALALGRYSTVYGMTSGPTVADMEPFHDTASRFLQEVKLLLDDGGLWNCPSSELSEDQLSPRTLSTFPPTRNERRQWLRKSETIVNMEHSLLFCAPPNTGSLQFRMLAKRMKGVDHWSVSSVQSLLFDAVDSKLPLLDLTNKRLMEEIYKENGSGWIKIGVVRDPVTRLLSAYLDLVQTWPDRETNSSFHGVGLDKAHRALSVDDNWEWYDAIRTHWGLKGDEAKQQQSKAGEDRTPLEWEGYVEEAGAREAVYRSRLLRDAVVTPVPTFERLLGMLEVHLWEAPSAFRPASRTCGMGLSPFDAVIPFETLQLTATKVLKSLPGKIWSDFGESGWGPQGKHAFMEFDYGTVARHYPYADQDTSPPHISPRARDLFSEDSCAWTEYYTSQDILEKVGRLYSEDFELFGWYDLDSWREKLEACLK